MQYTRLEKTSASVLNQKFWSKAQTDMLIKKHLGIWKLCACFWLSPAGLRLEVGAKIREAVSYWFSTKCFVPIATLLMVELPGVVSPDCGSVLILYMVWVLYLCIFSLLLLRQDKSIYIYIAISINIQSNITD